MRVVVLRGGRSSEHEISLASGAAVAEGLAEAGHEVLGVEIGRDGIWRRDGDEIDVVPGRGLLGADVVFPVLHGPFGEDGTVQGLLECLDVAYVGAGVLASAVCMDKVLFKDLMAHAGLPQVDYRGVEHREWRDDPERVLEGLEALGLPVFVKPARLGSSVGIVRVAEARDLADAVTQALGHDERAIVEAASGGVEVECSVIGHTGAPEASQPGEIVVAERDWYDYEAKYTPGGMELVVPARISEAARERVREVAAQAFTLSGCEGLARVDFFVEGEEVVLNELNTIPGFTATSVFGKLFEASGLPYRDLLDRLARLGVERHEAERAYRH
ncbi:MAG TPA: D-alanine--D-alanine ligase family protein [Solirubrobacteraceae bacterium]|nr:D-alanine--D-alanine ligase family protein [Solirubrobacteraceae bacterium]